MAREQHAKVARIVMFGHLDWGGAITPLTAADVMKDPRAWNMGVP